MLLGELLVDEDRQLQAGQAGEVDVDDVGLGHGAAVTLEDVAGVEVIERAVGHGGRLCSGCA